MSYNQSIDFIVVIMHNRSRCSRFDIVRPSDIDTTHEQTFSIMPDLACLLQHVPYCFLWEWAGSSAAGFTVGFKFGDGKPGSDKAAPPPKSLIF